MDIMEEEQVITHILFLNISNFMNQQTKGQEESHNIEDDKNDRN